MTGVVLTIYTQKVVLDDIRMNTFFCDVLDEFFEITIEYSRLGGRGCELALNLVEAVPRTG